MELDVPLLPNMLAFILLAGLGRAEVVNLVGLAGCTRIDDSNGCGWDRGPVPNFAAGEARTMRCDRGLAVTAVADVDSTDTGSAPD